MQNPDESDKIRGSVCICSASVEEMQKSEQRDKEFGENRCRICEKTDAEFARKQMQNLEETVAEFGENRCRNCSVAAVIVISTAL
jgi:hypothetical protein